MPATVRAQRDTAAPRGGSVRIALVALVVAAFGAATACGSEAPPPPAAGSSAVIVSPDFNPTDAAWLQIMIPMTRHMLDALAMAPDHASDPALRTTAAAVLGEYRTQADRLDALRIRAGLPDTDIHAGHQMPGMVTEADLTMLGASRGAEFDRHLRSLLDEHLAQTTLLAEEEQSAGGNHDTTALARTVEQISARDRGRLLHP